MSEKIILSAKNYEKVKSIKKFIELVEKSNYDNGFQVYGDNNEIKVLLTPNEIDDVIKHLKNTMYLVLND